MTEPASLTPVGDRLRDVFAGEHGRGTTHSAGCAGWHSLCAYRAGREEALHQLAADLGIEARAIAALGEVPWAAMLGLEVTSAAEAAAILMRAAEVALQRAAGPLKAAEPAAEAPAPATPGRPLMPP